MRLPGIRAAEAKSFRDAPKETTHRTLMESLREHAGSLHGDVDQIRHDLDNVSGRVDEEAHRFQSLLDLGRKLASINETTDGTARDARQSTAEADQAVESSRGTLSRSLEDIRELTGSVTAIQERVAALESALDEVGDAADSIAYIAKQTNLLALNATIEATRAGEVGRGFAVVAEHVKELAKQAGDTTAEITEVLDALRQHASTLIERSRHCSELTNTVQSGTDTLQKLLDTVGGAMASVDGAYTRINESVRQINQSCHETVDGLEGMSTDVDRSRHALAEAKDHARSLAQTTDRLTEAVQPQGQEDTAASIAAAADATGALTVNVSDIAGAAHSVQGRIATEAESLKEFAQTTAALEHSSREAHGAAEEARQSAEATAASLSESSDDVQGTVSALQDMTTQVREIYTELDQLQEALTRVRKSSGGIAAIAKQTNFLAVNASIEAARAGSSGHGFSVVAEQVSTLATETGTATHRIEATLNGLARTSEMLMERGEDGAQRAARVESDSESINEVVATLRETIDRVSQQSGRIASATDDMSTTCSQAETELGELRGDVNRSADDLANASARLDDLLGKGERLLNLCNAADVETSDRPFIEKARECAAEAGARLEQAIADGRVSEADVFDRDHEPVPDTNPQQFTTRFVELTDALFPEFQEAAVDSHEKIISCCCTDDTGYIGTHNRKVSKPQRPDDPNWNLANSRHRQIYRDRVGKAAAESTEPFLLQAYRRNMGDRFVLAKDASAPIYVNARHWGACRVIYIP